MKPTILRSPNTTAPEEFGQFAFLAGEWDCERRQLQENGNYADPTHAKLIGSYVLNGYAFQDEMLSPFEEGLGVTWRTYDVDKKQWACRWLQAGTDTSSTFSNDWFCGNFVDGEMRLSGSGANERGPYDFRIVFTNISDNISHGSFPTHMIKVIVGLRLSRLLKPHAEGDYRSLPSLFRFLIISERYSFFYGAPSNGPNAMNHPRSPR